MLTQITQEGTISRRIRFLRGKETQERFSKRLGISRSALANYETGRSRPNEFVLKQIADALNMPVEYFGTFDLKEDPSPAALYGSVIEGKPDWTGDEVAIINVLRVCPRHAVLKVIELLIEAASCEELTVSLGRIFSIKEDFERLIAIASRKGLFQKGSIAVDGETWMRRLQEDAGE